MQPLKNFQHKLTTTIFTDIDDTLTTHGQLTAEAYAALWRLGSAGFRVIPVTGRPAGWCELIARQWPVHGVIGENGAFYFRLDQGIMRRHFVETEEARVAHQQKLQMIQKTVLEQVPGAALASDQFCRLFDLAIDFCEDVKPLPSELVHKIVEIFHTHGAQAKISSIHVNGWFGSYDKLSTCQIYARNELKFSTEAEFQAQCVFIGDSPNDEPMFAHFQSSFAVANIQHFLEQLRHRPRYVTLARNSAGFVEFANHLISV